MGRQPFNHTARLTIIFFPGSATVGLPFTGGKGHVAITVKRKFSILAICAKSSQNACVGHSLARNRLKLTIYEHATLEEWYFQDRKSLQDSPRAQKSHWSLHAAIKPEPPAPFPGMMWQPNRLFWLFDVCWKRARTFFGHSHGVVPYMNRRYAVRALLKRVILLWNRHLL